METETHQQLTQQLIRQFTHTGGINNVQKYFQSPMLCTLGSFIWVVGNVYNYCLFS